jgi:hypothetical protein
MTSSTHKPHHLVVGDYSLDTATYAAVAHGLIQDRLYHYRGDAKTAMRLDKRSVLVRSTQQSPISSTLMDRHRNGFS